MWTMHMSISLIHFNRCIFFKTWFQTDLNILLFIKALVYSQVLTISNNIQFIFLQIFTYAPRFLHNTLLQTKPLFEEFFDKHIVIRIWLLLGSPCWEGLISACVAIDSGGTIKLAIQQVGMKLGHKDVLARRGMNRTLESSLFFIP